MTHRVQALRRGEGALLSCAICKASLSLPERDFEAMNRFILEHQPCLTYST
jgi:hypothetical protein